MKRGGNESFCIFEALPLSFHTGEGIEKCNEHEKNNFIGARNI